MTDWVNSVADHLASQGFIALAPDMITGMEGNAMRLIRALTPEQMRSTKPIRSPRYQRVGDHRNHLYALPNVSSIPPSSAEERSSPTRRRNRKQNRPASARCRIVIHAIALSGSTKRWSALGG